MQVCLRATGSFSNAKFEEDTALAAARALCRDDKAYKVESYGYGFMKIVESGLSAVLGLENAPDPAVVKVVRHCEESRPQQLGVDLGALVVGVGEDLGVGGGVGGVGVECVECVEVVRAWVGEDLPRGQGDPDRQRRQRQRGLRQVAHVVALVDRRDGESEARWRRRAVGGVRVAAAAPVEEAVAEDSRAAFVKWQRLHVAQRVRRGHGVAGVVPARDAHEARRGVGHIDQGDPARVVPRRAVCAHAALAAEPKGLVAVWWEAGLAGRHAKGHPVEGQRVAREPFEQRRHLSSDKPDLIVGHDEGGRPARGMQQLDAARERAEVDAPRQLPRLQCEVAVVSHRGTQLFLARLA
eukprot:scaffold148_cov78-Phaeocystis_antarctica.AAC.19